MCVSVPKVKGSVFGIMRDASVTILFSLLDARGSFLLFSKAEASHPLVKYTVLNGLYFYIIFATTQSIHTHALSTGEDIKSTLLSSILLLE